MSKDFSDLEWRKVTNALSVSQLHTGDLKHECALYQIAAGGKIPEHDHKGAEMTVVISGGFSDRQGVYHKGGFYFSRKGPDSRANSVRVRGLHLLASFRCATSFYRLEISLDESISSF